MTEHKVFHRGDVLIDPIMATVAQAALSHGLGIFTGPWAPTETVVIDSLAQLIEAAVVHERLVFPLRDLDTIVMYPDWDCCTIVQMEGTALDYMSRQVHERELARLKGDPLYKDMIDLQITPEAIEGFFSDFYYTKAFRLVAAKVAVIRGLSMRARPDILNDDRSYSFAETILEKVEDVVDQKIHVSNEYLKDYFTLDVPIIFNHVITKARTRSDIIGVAMELRETKEARAFRRQLTLLDEAAAVDAGKLVREIIDEIDDKIKALGKKLGQPTLDLQIAFPPSISLNFGHIANIVHRRKRHLVFIQQLYEWGTQARTIRREMGKLF